MKKRRIFCAASAPLLLFLAGFLTPDSAQACHVKFGQQLKLPQVLTSQNISISVEDADVQICPSGAATHLWTIGGTFPPPTIRRPTNPNSNNQGPTNVTYTNNLGLTAPAGFRIQDELGNGTQTGVAGDHTEITLHHHGSHVAPIGDGWACGYYLQRSSVNPGNSSRTYTFFLRENDDANNTGGERGTTEWVHNHRVDVTGHTGWRGIAGQFFIIDDPADPRVSVPGGSTDPTGGNPNTNAGVIPRGPAVTNNLAQPAGFKFDVSLLIRDLQINSSNQAPYVFDGQGTTGNHILVNGVPQPNFNVQRRKYFFRALVPGNARKYFMRLRRSGSSTNINLLQVQSDGGFLANAVNRTIIPVGIAERVGFVVDFSSFAVGTKIILQNVQSTSDGGDCVPSGRCSTATSEIMQFTVTENFNAADGPEATVVNGTALRALPTLAGTPVKNRAFRFTSEGQPFWTIVREDLPNDDADRIMDCRRYDADPVVNTLERWTLHGVGNWTHSIHIHDVDQICESINGSSSASGCQTFNKFKETWPMAPGVTFVVRLKPTDFTQKAAEPSSNPPFGDACSVPAGGANGGFVATSTKGNCSNVSFGQTDGNADTIPIAEPVYHGTPSPAVNDPPEDANTIDGEVAGGRYMLHCHVLEHEDTAMMTQWRVKSVSNNGNTRSDVPCAIPGACSP